MFKSWRKNRAIKKIQEDCFHVYHIVSTYKLDISGTFASQYDWQDHHDLYCPKCDQEIHEIWNRDAERILETQIIRDEYKEKYL